MTKKQAEKMVSKLTKELKNALDLVEKYKNFIDKYVEKIVLRK